MTAFSAPSSASADSTYTVTGTITHLGGTTVYGTSAVIYLSPFSDIERDGGHIGLDIYLGQLQPGQSWNFSIEVTVPSEIANGGYYIGAVAYYSDETDKSNNLRSQPITISGGTTCTPDSHESDDTASAAKPLPFGEPQRHNHCEATSDWFSFNASGGTTYGIVTSQVGGWTAMTLHDTDGQTLLASGTSESAEFGASRLTWTAPANGTYYLRVRPALGPHTSGAGTDYDVTLGDLRPDLQTTSFYAPDNGLPGGTVTVSSAVRNQGFADAGSFEVAVYLSADPAVTTGDTLVGTRTIAALAADERVSSSNRYTLPSVTPGTYYLAELVNPDGSINEYASSNNTTPARVITISNPSDCTADAFEQDDNSSAAQPISVGADPQAHNHCEDAEDWLSFTAVANEQYAIRVIRVGGYADTWVELYAADGTTRLAGSSSDRTRAVDWQAPASGVYYLKIGNQTASPASDYTVKLDPKLPDLTQTMSITSAATSVIAGGFLDLHDKVTNVGHVATGPFEIGAYSSTDGAVTTSDTLVATRTIETLNPFGANEDYSNSAHFSRNTPPGTYYLASIADHGGVLSEISESNNTSTPVTVSVVAPSCAWDAYEDDDTPAAAALIVAGETQPRNHCDDGLDWVRFIPAASGAYVAVTGSSNLKLYASDGATPVTPHDTYFYSKISWLATAGTTYYLKNHNSTDSATSGGYSLNVFQCTQDAFENDDLYTAAQAISAGQTQSRNHCEDTDDWASFAATAGTAYTISSNRTDTYISLYDTGGTTILAVGQTQGKKRVISWTAPASGTYYIDATAFEFGQSTDYTLSLN